MNKQKLNKVPKTDLEARYSKPTKLGEILTKQARNLKKINKTLELRNTHVSEDEVKLCADLHNKYWSLIEKHFDSEQDIFSKTSTMQDIEFITQNFINTQVKNGTLPYGLKVSEVYRNPNNLKGCQIKLDLCPNSNLRDRDLLIGFVSGRLSFF